MANVSRLETPTFKTKRFQLSFKKIKPREILTKTAAHIKRILVLNVIEEE
jgi:hypothetical protein